MSVLDWATANNQLAGVLVAAVIGPLVMLIASRLLSAKAHQVVPPVAAPTADVRAVLAEIAASERLHTRSLETISEDLDAMSGVLAKHTVALYQLLAWAEANARPRPPP